MAYCPSCGDQIATDALSCPRCHVVFGERSSWQPLTEPPQPRTQLSIRYVPFFLYLSMVAGAGAITAAYPFWINNTGSFLSVIAWQIVTLPWSLLIFWIVVTNKVPDFLWNNKPGLLIVTVLLNAGFVLLNSYLLYRFARRRR